jgi:hypothetical protein
MFAPLNLFPQISGEHSGEQKRCFALFPTLAIIAKQLTQYQVKYG